MTFLSQEKVDYRKRLQQVRKAKETAHNEHCIYIYIISAVHKNVLMCTEMNVKGNLDP